MTNEYECYNSQVGYRCLCGKVFTYLDLFFNPKTRNQNTPCCRAIPSIVNDEEIVDDDNTCLDCGALNPGRDSGINCPNCGV